MGASETRHSRPGGYSEESSQRRKGAKFIALKIKILKPYQMIEKILNTHHRKLRVFALAA